MAFDRLTPDLLVKIVGAEYQLRLGPVFEIGAGAQDHAPVLAPPFAHEEDEQAVPLVERKRPRVLVPHVYRNARPVDAVGRDPEPVRGQRALVAPVRVRIVRVVDHGARSEVARVLAQVNIHQVVLFRAAVFDPPDDRLAPVQPVIALPVRRAADGASTGGEHHAFHIPLFRVPDHRLHRDAVLIEVANDGALLLRLMHSPGQVCLCRRPRDHPGKAVARAAVP